MALLVFLSSLLLLLCSTATPAPPTSISTPPQATRLTYHGGRLLSGNITLSLVWYGAFTPAQRSLILDFLQSLSISAPRPSVSDWWDIARSYGGHPRTLSVAEQILDDRYSLGKSLEISHLQALASKTRSPRRNALILVLTAAEVAVEGFCMSRCGTHGHVADLVYGWVGNSASQCPGQCAWPFHQPVYGPQDPPRIPPGGDVGVDGMVINLATVLGGAVTNAYGDGYFQGPAAAPLEAVSACTGMFGSGSYPGNPGKLLVDKVSGASYNAHGVRSREFLLPAMWDPRTSTCKTIV